MIERDRDFNTFDVACDRCPNSATTIDTDGDWHAMIAELKDEGWRIQKDDDDWIHICPGCVEAESEDPFEGLAR